MDVLITPVGVADVDAVIELARQVWQQTYPGIISQEQIDYMLAQRYGRERLLAELGRPDVWWDKATVDGCLAGFSSCMTLAGGGEMKLDKLYVDSQRQRRGIGARLLEAVESHAYVAACQGLILAVNKRNAIPSASTLATASSWTTL
jgi:GNAT superfamily N-acetyltransferase